MKGKRRSAAPAGDLYTSSLFVGRRRFVLGSCDRWFILSTLHGLLDPEQTIEPYDRSLLDVGSGERRAWAKEVLAAIDATLGDVAGVVFELHAGAAYRDFGLVDGLRARGAEVVNPTAGLSQGGQLAFYAGNSELHDPRPLAPPPADVATTRSGYSPRAMWLAAHDGPLVQLPLVELERVLGRPLPASARQHRAWWGNNDRSPQAMAWLSAGWRVAAVDIGAGHVTFQKAPP